jgi:hypothetical protein
MLTHILLVALSTASTITACMTLSLSAPRNSRIISGSITDDEQTPCIINANLDRPGRDNQYCFTCVDGYAAWLSHDLFTLAYGHDEDNWRLETRDDGRFISASRWC